MKANAERIEKNTVQLEIEVEAEQFGEAIEKAYRRLVQRFNVPGFRKGKTPRQIFERHVGKGAILEEAMEAVVPEAYYKAVAETGIEPIEQPQVEVVQAEEGKPVIFKATVQVKPEVVLGQYREVEVNKPSTEVPEEEVTKALERLQQRHAKLITLEEGSVEKGDITVIDFLGKVDEVPFKGGEGVDYSLEIGSGSFIEGFEDQLIDIPIGETRDINVTFPENYQAAELAGKDAVFTVTVKGIKRKELADLDDEFAKDVSEFDTLEELRTDISNKLKEAAEERAKFQLRQEVVSKIVDATEIEVPGPMVESQLSDMLRNLEGRISSQGMTLENYLQFANTTMEDLQEKMQPDAVWAAKMNLVMEAIAKAEKIEATQEEIKEEAAKIARYYNKGEEDFLNILENKGQVDFIIDQIIREKTLQFLADNAKIIEGTNEIKETEEPQIVDTNEPKTE
jgi:trigger factor